MPPSCSRAAPRTDPIRRRIVERLGKGEATVTDLSGPFDVSGPAISRHLGVLERAGLITRERHGTWRTCRLRLDALAELGAWLGGLQPVWDRRFDSLEALLAARASVASAPQHLDTHPLDPRPLDTHPLDRQE